MMSFAEFGPDIEDVGVVFEDAHVIVVDKPSGLLSQPGRKIRDSLVERVRASRPQASGPLMMHRLDMDTSGLIVLAKYAEAHRSLSIQFEKREIVKRYRAVLEQAPTSLGGRISLPLRLDVDNRPMQIVCAREGRPSETFWRVVAIGCPEVIFHPMTGRTHQLRVHAADRRGLGLPIVGDRLYGRAGGRLLLHADRLGFRHPATRLPLICRSPLPADWPLQHRKGVCL